MLLSLCTQFSTLVLRCGALLYLKRTSPRHSFLEVATSLIVVCFDCAPSDHKNSNKSNAHTQIYHQITHKQWISTISAGPHWPDPTAVTRSTFHASQRRSGWGISTVNVKHEKQQQKRRILNITKNCCVQRRIGYTTFDCWPNHSALRLELQLQHGREGGGERERERVAYV